MPNQIHSKNTLPKNYDAGDMSFAYAQAHEATEWLSTLLSQTQTEVRRMQLALEQLGVHKIHFHTLNKLLDITEFMSDDQVNTFRQLHEEHNQEWEADKKGANL